MNTLYRRFTTYFIFLLTLLLVGCLKSKSPTIDNRDLVTIDGLVDGTYKWDGSDVEIRRLANNQYQVISMEESNGKRKVRSLSILALDGTPYDLAVIEEPAVSEKHANTEYRFIRSGRDGIQVAEISLRQFKDQLAATLGIDEKELDNKYGDEYKEIVYSMARDAVGHKKGINPELVTQEEVDKNLSEEQVPLFLAKADDEFKKRHEFAYTEFNGPVSPAVKAAERHKIFFDSNALGGDDNVLIGKLTSANLKALFSDSEFRAGIQQLQWGKLEFEYRPVQWYKQAAEQGNAQAQYQLGWMYEKGEGIEKNIDKALEWYRKAATQGQKMPRSALPNCHRKINKWRLPNSLQVWKKR